MNDLFENKSVNDTAVVTVNQINQFSPAKSLNSSVVPRSRFLLDTGIPPTEFQALPEFQGDTYKFWGTHQILKNFTY